MHKRLVATSTRDADNQGLVSALSRPGPRRKGSTLYGLIGLAKISVDEVVLKFEALGATYDGTNISIDIATLTALVREGRVGI